MSSKDTMSWLNEVSKVLSSCAFDQKNITSLIGLLLKDKISFSILVLLLAKGDQQTLVVAADRPLGKAVIQRVKNDMIARYKQQTGLLLEEDSVEVIFNRIPGLTSVAGPAEIRAEVCHVAPMLLLDRPLGLLGIFFEGPVNLSVEEETFLQVLATQVALFIENDQIRQDMAADQTRLESVLRCMIHGVMVIHNDDTVALANPAVEGLLGIPSRRMIGRSFREGIQNKNLVAVMEMTGDVNSPLCVSEVVVPKNGNGGRIIVRVRVAAVRDYLGKSLGRVVVLEDITQEKEVEQAKSDFVSVVSHELRTPITIVLEMISLVLEGGERIGTEERRKFLSMGVANLGRLTSMIGDLLDISKIEAGKMTVKRKPMDVLEVIHDVKEQFAMRAKERGLSIQEVVPKEALEIPGDRDKLIQIFINLIGNAMKFTEKGGITLRAQKIPTGVECRVEDTGPGIAKENLPQVFGKFRQFGHVAAGKEKGTGLGLAISKGLVELMGGKIHVESVEGNGTKFIFTLPQTEGKTMESKKRILLVDDEQDFREMIKLRLVSEGYEVLEAGDGEDAIAMGLQEKPDIVLMDIMMPKLDGYAALVQYKKSPVLKGIPVIMFSAKDEFEDIQMAEKLGAAGYLTKPFEAAKLLNALKAA